MWNLYGKKYDLTAFARFHPGGAEIIEKTKGLDDCTALFESYHAFSDLSGIKQSLEKYAIHTDDETVIVSNYNSDFATYHKLVEKVKEIFPDRDAIKAPPSWYMWNGISLVSFLFGIWYTIIIQNVFLKCILASISATVELSLLFNVLHDGSHYAISTMPNINNVLSKITNSWFLWNHTIWFYHHVYYHHSFTGGHNDPDKLLYDVQILKKNLWHENFFEPICNIIYGCFPGQASMQTLWYMYSSIMQQLSFVKKDFLKMKNIVYYDEVSMSIMFCKLIMLYNFGLFPTIVFITTENTLYYMNIYANHDLCETHENHYDGGDWAKRQICNAGNFINQNQWWTVAFSGINHQIEHHLFPNICGHHYTVVAPIVRKFCKENNLPYVHHDRFIDAYRSFIKGIHMKKEI
jgi:linoleoyl-CoA desaturase